MLTFKRCAALLGLTGLCAAQALSPAFDVTLKPGDPALICKARLSPALQLSSPPAGTKAWRSSSGMSSPGI
ncbi:hypothetical protein [Deinococcus sp.]|uniref:hypothetical protein n=1 Tax=Deinococcus sp. TaxID=47478 RepID=UPI0025FE6E4C|nr:hypothetical protein [Deinococcus sp.]